MKTARKTLFRCVACLIAGALLIGCPLSFFAWRWSLQPVSTTATYTVSEEEWTPEWIDANWPGRIVDPNTLATEEAESLRTIWPRAEYSARIEHIVYAWLGSVGVFAVLVLLTLIFSRPASRAGPANELDEETEARV